LTSERQTEEEDTYNLAKVLDKHISKIRSKFVIDFKTFHASDLVLTTRRQ